MEIFSNKRSIGQNSDQNGLSGKEKNSPIGESKKAKKRGRDQQAPLVEGLKFRKNTVSFVSADKKQKGGQTLQDNDDPIPIEEPGYQEFTDRLRDEEILETNALLKKQEALRMQLEENEEEIAITPHTQEEEDHLDDLLDERESLGGQLNETQPMPVSLRGTKISQRALMKRKILPSSSRRRRILSTECDVIYCPF